MYAVIFKAELNELDQEYIGSARRMRELAQTKYGCVDFISVTEGTQEISISYWENEEQIKQWKNDPEHITAQQLGRNKWYQSYEVQIVKIERQSSRNS